MAKVAVVTGSNKGIGYAIVRGLAKQWDGVIYLTARNEDQGKQAVETLKKELGEKGDNIRFHQLDIVNQESVTKLKNFVDKEHGGLDILVNNAGMAYSGASTAPAGEQAENTIGCNYFGTKRVCEALFPLLKPHARVVNVCSRVGAITKYNDALKKQFLDPHLTVAQLDALMNEYIKLAKEGTHVDKGYPPSTYGMSKAGEIALTFIQAKQISQDARPDIAINGSCPGWVQTDMSKQTGTKNVDEGADTMIYLALLPENIPIKGKFVGERKEVDWTTCGFPV